MSVDQDLRGDADPSLSQRADVVHQTTRRWAPITLFILMSVNVATRAAGPITDPDTWWHLRLGREFRDGWSLAHPGQLSPFATQPWVATQWTLEVAASFVEQWFGLAGVAAATGLATLALAAMLWLVCRRAADPLPACVAAALALLGTTPVIAPRPQIVTLVLLAVAVAAWRRTAVDLGARWWLVPVSWLWACTHGFWFLGVILGFAVVAGLWLDRRVTIQGAARLGLVPLFSLVAAAVTPAGPRLLLAPFMVNGVAQNIDEWQPPNFHEGAVMVVALMAAVVALSAARRGATPWTDLLVFVLAAMMLVYAGRTVAVAAVLLAPLTASSIQAWLGSEEPERPTPRERLVRGLGIVVGAIAVVLVVIAHRPYSDPFPDAIDRTLAGLPKDAVVFNAYGYGGWMAWQHPALTHGIDGMTEAYSPKYVAQYLAAERLAPGWESFLQRLGVTHAFLRSDEGLTWELETHLHWTVLARTKDYVVLEKPPHTG